MYIYLKNLQKWIGKLIRSYIGQVVKSVCLIANSSQSNSGSNNAIQDLDARFRWCFLHMRYQKLSFICQIKVQAMNIYSLAVWLISQATESIKCINRYKCGMMLRQLLNVSECIHINWSNDMLRSSLVEDIWDKKENFKNFKSEKSISIDSTRCFTPETLIIVDEKGFSSEQTKKKISCEHHHLSGFCLLCFGKFSLECGFLSENNPLRFAGHCVWNFQESRLISYANVKSLKGFFHLRVSMMLFLAENAATNCAAADKVAALRLVGLVRNQPSSR